MKSVLFVATLLLLFDLSLAQLGCQGKTGLFAADPNGPSQSYLQCASGTGEIKTCPGDSLFNPDSEEECDLPCEPCPAVLITRSEKLTCRSPNSLAPHTRDSTCRTFIQCYRRKPYVFDCPSDLVYDPKLEVCVFASQYNCVNKASTTTTPVPRTRKPRPGFNPCSREREGLFENKEDNTCKSYIQCSEGNPFTITCPNDSNRKSDLIFDPAKRYCVWDYQYQCPGRSGITTTTTPAPKPQKKIVCYYPNWPYYRKGKAKHVVRDLDEQICTHMIYAFATLDPSKHEMKVYDKWLDLDLKNYEKFTNLKNRKPELKLYIAIGGWTDSQENAGAYKEMFKSLMKRKNFARKAREFCKKYGFHGIDLDYEFPEPSDKAAYAAWVEDIANEFHPNGLEVTAAFSASTYKIERGLDVPKISQYLDAIHVMSYDLHGAWDSDKRAENHSPLYRRTWDKKDLNVDDAVNKFIELGASREKIIVGIPTYGRSYTIDSRNSKTPPGVIFTEAGRRGALTKEAGMLGYQEICLHVKNDGWTMVDSDDGPHAYKDDQWVGFDSKKSVKAKSKYILDNNLGGAMFWDTSTDDFNNQCGEGKYPLITTVADILNPNIERNFLRRQSIPEEDEVRDFTEDELKLEEEGANRASKIGNGRPINVDPNA